MRKLFAYLISFYQKRLSPHKGFICAHSGLHKGDSCSEYTKKQILEKGLFASLRAIKQRFNECSEAAYIIKQRPPLSQRGDCDFGLSACDVSGCDFGGSGGGSGGGSSISDGCSFVDCSSCDISRRNFIRILILVLVISIIAVTLSYYFIGRKIEFIDIRIKPGIQETTDGGALAKIFQFQQPDYKINFDLKNGSATSYTLRNISAKNWISLKTIGLFYFSDITRIVIVNEEITNSKELESIPKPEMKGVGKVFEYSIRQKWEWFR